MRYLPYGGGHGCGRTRIINYVLAPLFRRFYGPKGLVLTAFSNKAIDLSKARRALAAVWIGMSISDEQAACDTAKEEPGEEMTVWVDKIYYTQKSCGPRFRGEPYAGRPLEEAIADLESGIIDQLRHEWQEALKCLQAELHRRGGNAYLSPLASSVRWPCKFAALGKISTFVSKQTNAFRLVWDGRGPLAALLLEEDRAEGLLAQDHTQAAAKRMRKFTASSSALETYGRGQQRLYDESQLASSSVANRTREDANEVEVEQQQHEQNQQQAIDLQWEQQAVYYVGVRNV